MRETNNQYIKFMSDIIDSGLWGKLSPAAKTLYPVLLKFSDQNFKNVWPSTDTLLKLTGFKTKKSISLGKKELIKEGLLQYKPGSGRTNSTYYFSFNYEGSRITPQWGSVISPSGVTPATSPPSFPTPEQGIPVIPNNLNITINNNQMHKQENENVSLENLIESYGLKTVENALIIAKSKNLEDNLHYVRGICLNQSKEKGSKMPNFKQEIDTAQHVIDSWKNFLEWARLHLTRTSIDILEKIPVEVDGCSIFIRDILSDFLKQIVLKYFNEQVSPPIIVVFSEQIKVNY